MTSGTSYRQVLRTTTIIGAASLATIFISLIRTKAVAVLLGPAGVGLIGLLQNLMSTASTVAALGVATSGTRQIAEAASDGDGSVLLVARRALFWVTLALATIGAVIVWSLRHLLAEHVLGSSEHSLAVGWIAVGVALSVASGSQGALLNGLRRVGDMARLSVASAILSTVLGLVALWFMGENGVLLFVLSWPLANLIFGHWYVSRLPRTPSDKPSVSGMIPQWRSMIRLGASFMLAGLAVVLGQLAVQVLIQRELGISALGHFQAAWMISMTYVGLVLQAMSSDYYPRLTAAINDHNAANRLVNEQAEIGIILSGPIFVAMIGCAPWVIQILYTRDFNGADVLLRWQVLGDILKVAGAPLIYVVLASGAGRTFMVTQVLSTSAFVALTWAGLPYWGAQASGIAFLAMYIIHFFVLCLLARRYTNFRWCPRIVWQLFLLLTLCSMVFLVSVYSNLVGAAFGLLIAGLLGVHAIVRLRDVAGLDLSRDGILEMFRKFKRRAAGGQS